MQTPSLRGTAFCLCALLCATACGKKKNEPALSKPAEEVGIPDVPPPPENGPKLGAIAEITPVLDRPATTGKQLGYLHAGATIARTEQPYSSNGCSGGWYPIRPKGFVCAGDKATTDVKHPTLVAMAQQPKLDQTLPYAYGRAIKETALYERDTGKESAVKESGKLRPNSVLAAVGSWNAMGPDGKMERLALMTNGSFVRAADLRPAVPSEFHGVEVNEKNPLPVGFVVKRGVKSWRVEKGEAEKIGSLSYHETLRLTGKFRTSGPLKYWATDDDRYVRHRDVTVIRKRNVWPEFATGDQKWIDVSVVTGTLILYEGQTPVFVTLVSVGHDRTGDPKTTASTAQGTFDIVGKHITAAKFNPKGIQDYIDVYDAPWSVELSSGQILCGALWHDRFGIEHGLGQIQLSPTDAQRVWQWVEPSVPAGWHGMSQPGEKKTFVVVRK